MTIEQKLNALMEDTEALDLDLLESVRQKVAIAEAKKETKKNSKKKDDEKKDDDSDDKQEADQQDQEPAVTINNPINPQLDASQDGESGDDTTNKQQQQQANESLSDIFGEEFSDDFKLKASTIFEAAIKEKTREIEKTLKAEYAAKAAAIEESFQIRLVEESSKIEESLSEDINGYLTTMTEEWMRKNELAVMAGVKAELTESFINGMKTLFEEHYVDLPEEKVDLIGKLQEEKQSLEDSLSQFKQINEELSDKLNSATREQIITESAKEFTELDFQRFKLLTEDFVFEDETQFRKKMDIVKKAFFEAKAERSGKKDRLNESFTPAAPIIEEQAIS